MIEMLVSVIKEICNDQILLSSDEASIKSGVVLRLLSLLGWNPFDVNEVKPEYKVESGWVDFSLRINGTNKTFIEVKRPNENLEPHQEQLLGYSFREGVKIAILTNGFTWWFYLPLNEGNWEQRRFFTADFTEQVPESIAGRFMDLLSKENIASGKALNNAEELYKSRQRKDILQQTLPIAWHKLISEPDDSLVNLIIDTVEKISGFRPEENEVKRFLNNLCIKIAGAGSSTPSLPPIRTPKVPTQSSIGYINKQIRTFTLFGKTYSPRSWKELLATVSEEIYRRHSVNFEQSLNLRGTRMNYFSTKSIELSQPARISNSEYFVETKLNSNSIVKRCFELLALFGYQNSDLSIDVK